MGFQNASWNISMSGLVILTAAGFLDIMWKTDRQTEVKTISHT